MNKTEAISKINKMGKVGAIVCLVGKIILFVAAFLVLLAGIAFFILPKDFITIQTTSMVNTSVDISKFTAGISVEELMEMKNKIESSGTDNGTLSLDENEYAISSITFDDSKVNVNTEVLQQTVTSGQIRSVFIVALLAIGCTLLSFFFAGDLCKAFEKCASPFEAEIITKIRNLAFSLIPMVIVSSFADGFVTSAFTVGKNYSFSVNVTSIFVILVILAVSYIFKYGAQLQQESDETL